MRALRKKLDAEAAERRKREEMSKNREGASEVMGQALTIEMSSHKNFVMPKFCHIKVE